MGWSCVSSNPASRIRTPASNHLTAPSAMNVSTITDTADDAEIHEDRVGARDRGDVPGRRRHTGARHRASGRGAALCRGTRPRYPDGQRLRRRPRGRAGQRPVRARRRRSAGGCRRPRQTAIAEATGRSRIDLEPVFLCRVRIDSAIMAARAIRARIDYFFSTFGISGGPPRRQWISGSMTSL